VTDNGAGFSATRAGGGGPSVLPVHSSAQLARWPDTSGDEPPADDLYRSATWLLGRHPQLAELAARVPGIVEAADDGLGVELEALAAALVDHDAGVTAWAAYERAHRRAPDDDARYVAWQDAASR